MQSELKLILELIKDKPNKDLCKDLIKKIKKENFLYLASEFPVDKITTNLKRLNIDLFSEELNSIALKNVIKNEILIKQLLKFTKAYKNDFILIKSFSNFNLVLTRRTSDIDILVDIKKLKKIIINKN
jgi:archaellum biogenesis ATPase FlaH